MMKLFRTAIGILATALAVSCNSLEISDHDLRFSASGGEKGFTTAADVHFVGIKNTTTKAFIKINDAADWERYPFTLNGAWFTIERKDAKTFTVTAEPNKTGAVRSFIIYLEDDDFYDSITVSQKK